MELINTPINVLLQKQINTNRQRGLHNIYDIILLFFTS